MCVFPLNLSPWNKVKKYIETLAILALILMFTKSGIVTTCIKTKY